MLVTITDLILLSKSKDYSYSNPYGKSLLWNKSRSDDYMEIFLHSFVNLQWLTKLYNNYISGWGFHRCCGGMQIVVGWEWRRTLKLMAVERVSFMHSVSLHAQHSFYFTSLILSNIQWKASSFFLKLTFSDHGSKSAVQSSRTSAFSHWTFNLNFILAFLMGEDPVKLSAK